MKYRAISAAVVLLAVAASVALAMPGTHAKPIVGAAAPTTAVANSDQNARQILEQAIDAHGGYEVLRAASAWIAEVRRYQRGGFYEMTHIYRPGMIRLEQDMPGGGRSADVIGYPHCWGMLGPASIPCSSETRENDRPRVVMEMAAQLWTLLGADWQIDEDSGAESPQDRVRIFVARYLPLDTDVTIGIDANSGLLSYMTVAGTKAGVVGTHRHEYADFRERCGVLMPFGNVKSFDGEVWVREEFLSLRCTAVNESLFARPPQVQNGFTQAGTIVPTTLACATRDILDALPMDKIGPPLQLLEENGTKTHCVPVGSVAGDAPEGVTIRQLERQKSVESYFSKEIESDGGHLTEAALEFAEENGLQLGWPRMLHRFDNDGMGITGEVIILFAAPVTSISSQPPE